MSHETIKKCVGWTVGVITAIFGWYLLGQVGSTYGLDYIDAGHTGGGRLFGAIMVIPFLAGLLGVSVICLIDAVWLSKARAALDELQSPETPAEAMLEIYRRFMHCLNWADRGPAYFEVHDNDLKHAIMERANVPWHVVQRIG